MLFSPWLGSVVCTDELYGAQLLLVVSRGASPRLWKLGEESLKNNSVIIDSMICPTVIYTRDIVLDPILVHHGSPFILKKFCLVKIELTDCKLLNARILYSSLLSDQAD